MKIHSPGFTRSGGNPHMRWESVRHHLYVGSGSFHFQSRRVMTCSPRYQLVCRMWYAWRNGCGSICWSPGTPLWELRSTACKVQRPTKWICVEWQVECNIESLDPEDQSRCGGWPNRWWEFLLHFLPWLPRGVSLSRTQRKPNPWPSVWRLSVSWKPFLRSWHLLRCVKWRYVLLPDPIQRIQANQLWWGSRSHLGSQRQQGSGIKQHSIQDLETSSSVSGIYTRLDF